MTPLYKLGLEIAKLAHKGQFRDGPDRLPYITHPVEVASMVREYLTVIFLGMGSKPDMIARYVDLAEFLALTHDALEDGGDKVKLEEISEALKAITSEEEHEMLIKDMIVLDKHGFKDYLTYVLAVKERPIPRVIKMKDIEHNFATTPKGSRKDKYRMAYFILTGTKID